MWKRYRFKTKSIKDYRPLEFDPRFPWWCSGEGDDHVTILVYLPITEDLLKYWDDAYDIEFEETQEIVFTDRFPKASWFEEMTPDPTIPINLWDDYWEDDFVPEGEIQKTFMYVENYEFSLEDTKKYLELLLDFIYNNFDLPNVKMWLELYESAKKYPNFVGTEHECMLFNRWEIKFENLSHKKANEMLLFLEKSNLKFDGKIFIFYSES